MATFPDLSTVDHFLEETGGEELTLPIRGRSYTWRAGDLSMWALLKLRRLDEQIVEATRKAEAGEPVENEIALTTAEQKRLDLELLGGENYARMVDEGVRKNEANHVAATLMTWHLLGRDAALDAWSLKNREKPADPPARAASTKTAGSSTRKTPAARRSVGAKSSSTGTSSRRTSRGSTKQT